MVIDCGDELRDWSCEVSKENDELSGDVSPEAISSFESSSRGDDPKELHPFQLLFRNFSIFFKLITLESIGDGGVPTGFCFKLPRYVSVVVSNLWLTTLCFSTVAECCWTFSDRGSVSVSIESAVEWLVPCSAMSFSSVTETILNPSLLRTSEP